MSWRCIRLITPAGHELMIGVDDETHLMRVNSLTTLPAEAVMVECGGEEEMTDLMLKRDEHYPGMK